MYKESPSRRKDLKTLYSHKKRDATIRTSLFLLLLGGLDLVFGFMNGDYSHQVLATSPQI